MGFAYDVFGHHNTTVRGGYGIFYVREDVGAVDQLSFQSPFIPIVFFGQTQGFTMSDFFTGTPATNANAVPAAGQLSGAWLPCLAHLTSFTPNSPSGQDASYACTGGPGVNSTQNLFVLEVPRHFVVPNTQQWNLTLQRDLGRKWVLEVGYVGTKGTHLRETRDAIQSVNAESCSSLHRYRHQRQQLSNHRQHLLQCHRAHPYSWIERIFRLSDLR